MKTSGLLTGIILALIFSLPFAAFSQQINPEGPSRSAHHETPDMPYMALPADHRTSLPATIRTTEFTMVQANVDAGGHNILGDAANEPCLAIDPTNSQNIVIGWRQFDNIQSNFRQAGYAYSSDGGQTWTFPGVIDPGIFRSDPVLDCDADGGFYYNSLTSDGFNYFCRVFKSINGGSAWDQGTDAHGGDKQWMTIDKTSGQGIGNIYSAWNYYYSSCYPGSFIRSVDAGNTYSDCTSIPGNPYWGTMTTGNHGEVYVVGAGDFGPIMVSRSDNAQYGDSTETWNTTLAINLNVNLTMGLLVNPAGITGQANISVDRSNGPGRDNVYVLASLLDYTTSDSADVYFARSTDGGVTWDEPVRINDDSPLSFAYQWFGTMSVAPNGRIDVIWLDTRNSPPDSLLSALYYSYSLDQGQTWSVNQQLSPMFNSRIGWPQQAKMGDYYYMISDDDAANLAWANTLNGEQDVYFSRITPFPTGVSENINHEIRLSAFPNPFRNEASVRYDLPTPDFVNVSLTDISGRIVKTLVSGYQERGSHNLNFSGTELSDGYYFLNISCGNSSRMIKMVKAD